MRKFSSYGPVDKELHYYAPRTALIDYAEKQLLGEDLTKGGHYITIWAPRQTGKSWVMREVIKRVKTGDDFEIGVISLQSAKTVTDDQYVLEVFVNKLRNVFGRAFPNIQKWAEISSLFTSAYFSKPVILIIDEFDALQESFINRFANEFRGMYLERVDESDLPSGEKSNLLHGLALIGVRSVLGIENVTGSPFNVQRSVHIPNLNQEEVVQIFQDYQDESGQRIVPEVVTRIYDEMKGQPGLTCWFGELLTEVHNRHDGEITLDDFAYVYSDALDVQPNNNILNIISKAKMDRYQPMVLEMYQSGTKLPFHYDDVTTNYLYMNGVLGREITREETGEYKHYVKFPSPFVQKRLFNYFSHLLFNGLKRLHDPFADLSNTITNALINIPNVMRLHEAYLQNNRSWLFKHAPRRKTDDRLYEAVFHFNLYMYLMQLFVDYNAYVVPEFPTGNGKIDLLINHNGQRYLLELKSFANKQQYHNALEQAASYGKQLKMSEAWLVFFVEAITDEQRAVYEVTYRDVATGVVVYPVFVTVL